MILFVFVMYEVVILVIEDLLIVNWDMISLFLIVIVLLRLLLLFFLVFYLKYILLVVMLFEREVKYVFK